ncbi:MAG: peptidylprolyl isomerase [Elusimicrobia bacterium]|nr:peptidylprolyl isomerase [Elusimicrobiota bacterium]
MAKTATIKTNRGDIRIELFDKDCPKTVASFEKLAEEKFYDGLKWHRVIKDFMIQGGCPHSKTGGGRVGTGGPGYATECELRPKLKHVKGALSMAHAGSCRHDDSGKLVGGTCSNGSQFFITHVPTPHLDGVHTVFGKVIEGQEVVDAVKQDDDIISISVA